MVLAARALPVQPFVDWRQRAACRGADVFFSTNEDPALDPPYLTPEQAVLCGTCPVVQDCLQYAIEHNEVGVWGNTTWFQRQQMKRTRARMKCPGCDSDNLVIEGAAEVCLSCGCSWYVPI